MVLLHDLARDAHGLLIVVRMARDGERTLWSLTHHQFVTLLQPEPVEQLFRQYEPGRITDFLELQLHVGDFRDVLYVSYNTMEVVSYGICKGRRAQISRQARRNER